MDIRDRCGDILFGPSELHFLRPHLCENAVKI